MTGLVVAVCCLSPVSVQAQNQTVSGTLTVTGDTDLQGGTLTFGTRTDNSQPGALTLYTDGTTSTLEFDASRSANIWKWQQNGNATLQLQMTLDNNNKLTLYNSSGAAAITLDPNGTSTIAGSTTFNGTSNTMPNQTLTGGLNSVLTESLGNGLYLPLSASTLALGTGNSATGTDSVALGFGTTASGNYATALGYGTTAQAYGEVAVGQFNVGGGTASSYVATDPAFEVGNGTSSGSLSDALSVLKNGNIGIGTATPASSLYLFSSNGSTSPSSPNPVFSLSSTNSGAGTSNAIDFNTYASEGAGTGNAPGGRITFTDDGNFSGEMIFSNKIPGHAENALQPNLAISDVGNVGIGTATPASSLYIASSDGSTSQSSPNPVISLMSTNNGSGTSNAIDFNTYVGEGAGSGHPPGGRITFTDDGNYSGEMIFSNKFPGSQDNALQAHLAITDVGKVGIGTTSPVAQLEVNGTAQVDGVVTVQPGGDIPMFSGN